MTPNHISLFANASGRWTGTATGPGMKPLTVANQESALSAALQLHQLTAQGPPQPLAPPPRPKPFTRRHNQLTSTSQKSYTPLEFPPTVPPGAPPAQLTPEEEAYIRALQAQESWDGAKLHYDRVVSGSPIGPSSGLYYATVLRWLIYGVPPRPIVPDYPGLSPATSRTTSGS